MLTRLLLPLLISLPFFVFSQYRMDVRNVADCYGNSFIRHPGDYELQFTGRKGTETDLSAYPTLAGLQLNNTFWSSFTAPHDGLFMFSGITENCIMDILIFSAQKKEGEESSSSYTNICENIKVGTAVIERIVKVKGNQHFGLNKSPNEQFLYGLRMTEGMEIYLFFNASVSQRIKVSLKVEYEVDYSDIDVESLKSITDMRGNSNHSELRIQLRDKSTGLPIKGKLLIDNSKRINGLYSGSDFIFSIQEREHLKLSIDVIGYFFQDQEVFVEAEKNKEIILWLEPAELGKKMEIQGIQFKTGSSELLKGAEVKLVRLKDFLLLNSSIHIEIEGHVFEYGESTFAGRRMSVARANTVMKYLIDSGVSRSRLSAKGYGNEFMIYPEPKFDWQEQANRRVEIRILKE